jgi:hypothetical protein
MSARDKVIDLAIEGQEGLDGREAAVRTGGLIQAAQLLKYLELTLAEYDEASERFMKHVRRQMAIAQQREPVPRDLETDEVQALHDGEHLAAVLHLRIETFYVFAKVLLDKLAQAIEGFFGEGRTASLSKHSKLRANLREYVNQKGLSSPDEILDLAESLDQRIVAYRDYYVVHDQSARSFKATMFDGEGRTRIAAGRLYPRESEMEGVQSEVLHDLMEGIEEYIASVCDFVRGNREKRT